MNKPLQMTHVGTPDEVVGGPLGAYCVTVHRCQCHGDKNRYLHLKDPTGAYAALPLNPRPRCEKQGTGWDWNKDRLYPTLEPSILNHANAYHPEWHGWVHNGQLVVQKPLPPKLNKEDRQGRYCASYEELLAGPPGSFYYSRRNNPSVIHPPQDNSIQGMYFKSWWPEDARRSTEERMRDLHFLPFSPGFGGDHWTWDGNLERPTLMPSIRVSYPFAKAKNATTLWHGYLKAGVFRNCEK